MLAKSFVNDPDEKTTAACGGRGEKPRRPAARRRGRAAAVAAVLTLGAATSLAAVETVALKRPLDVLDGKAGTADVVESLKPGAKVEVLGREGNWARLRTAAGHEGYAPKAALADSQSGDVDLSGITGGPTASERSASAAGKGWAEVDQYAGSHNLSQDGLKHMIEVRSSVSSADFRKFVQDGKLAAPRGAK